MNVRKINNKNKKFHKNMNNWFTLLGRCSLVSALEHSFRTCSKSQ